MAEIFEIYNQQIMTIMTQISDDFNNLNNTIDDQTHQLLSHLESNFKECDKLIKTLEIQQVTGTNNPNSYLYIKNYITGLDQYKKRYNREKEKFEDERKKGQLFYNSDTISSNDNLSKQHVDNYSLAYHLFDNLEKAKRESMKIELKGIEIVEEMSTQTDQMKNIGGKVTTMNGQLTSSSSLLSEMEIHHQKNKRFLISLATILLLLFLTVAAFRLISSKNYSNANNTNLK